MMDQPTYVFRDSQAYAIREGKVIASGADLDAVQAQVKQAYSPADFSPEEKAERRMTPSGTDEGYIRNPEMYNPDSYHICQNCGADYLDPDGQTPCPACGQTYDQQDIQRDIDAPGGFAEEMGRGMGMQAKTVATPNGLKGTVLGKAAGLWGEEVTVRLANGRIVKLPTGTHLTPVQAKKQAAAGPNRIQYLEARFASVADGTSDSLHARSQELHELQTEARAIIASGVTYTTAQRLDNLIVQADVEQHEIADAIAELDAAEPVVPRSFSMQAAHSTAGVSREDASWLDESLDQIIKAAEATDFKKLMDEGPEAFAAELPDNAIADQGTTAHMAANFIAEKTAGIERDTAEPYNKQFIARVEQCRRAQLSQRLMSQKKAAAVQDDPYKDVPDDAVFW